MAKIKSQNMHLPWTYTTSEKAKKNCVACKGEGTKGSPTYNHVGGIPVPAPGGKVKCSECNGTGEIRTTAFRIINEKGSVVADGIESEVIRDFILRAANSFPSLTALKNSVSVLSEDDPNLGPMVVQAKQAEDAIKHGAREYGN